MSRKIQHVAIIGYGSIGKRHFENLREICPQAKVTIISQSASLDEIPENAFHVRAIDQCELETVDLALV
jgi:ketol-acid reductoisomerase